MYFGCEREDERTRYKRGEVPTDPVCWLCEKKFDPERCNSTKDTCNTCMTNRHRWALKAQMVEYKGGGCQLCGYNRCSRSLDFHHIDPTQKDFSFAGKHCYGWSRLRAEASKCVCVCRNCHGEVHQALDVLEWGQPPAPILAKLDEVHANWTPPSDQDSYSPRDHWRDHHPKFRDPNRPEPYHLPPEFA